MHNVKVRRGIVSFKVAYYISVYPSEHGSFSISHPIISLVNVPKNSR